MKQVFIDVETTGLNPEEHAITQIGAIVVIDHEIQEEVNIMLKPFFGAKIDEQALKVTGVSIENLFYSDDRLSYEAGIGTFHEILKEYVNPYDKFDKMFFMGYNAPFDYGFIRKAFIKLDYNFFGSYFWTPPIDVMTWAAIALMDKRKDLPNFKLGTVCDYLGIKANGVLHNAMTDIELTFKLYQHLRKIQ